MHTDQQVVPLHHESMVYILPTRSPAPAPHTTGAGATAAMGGPEPVPLLASWELAHTPQADTVMGDQDDSTGGIEAKAGPLEPESRSG